MKPPEVKEQFITLRAQGLTYVEIGRRLGVHRNTLIKWSKELQIDVANERAIQMEVLQERYYALKRQRLEQCGKQLKAILTELERRDLKAMPTDKLLSQALKFFAFLRGEEEEINFQATYNIEDAKRQIANGITGVSHWKG